MKNISSLGLKLKVEFEVADRRMTCRSPLHASTRLAKIYHSKKSNYF